MKQEHTVTSKVLQEKLEIMNKSPQKKVVTHRFEPTSKKVLLFIGGLALSLVLSIWAISPNGESIKIGRRQI